MSGLVGQAGISETFGEKVSWIFSFQPQAFRLRVVGISSMFFRTTIRGLKPRGCKYLFTNCLQS
jgi:hypothetical protein